MTGPVVLLILALCLVVLGVVELAVHRRRLEQIPVRLHVNGTRGKSSVVRLIAAGLRHGGRSVCAKTTGTLARFILPDGRELPIYRPAGANIIEQRRIVAVAAACQCEVLVIECMALQPALQSLCERQLVRATHGIVTNARPDHLDVMGPGEVDVARALAGTTPIGGKLFTSEERNYGIFEEAAADRGSSITQVVPADGMQEELAGFAYTEHADNVALALAVCEELGVEADVALRGMQQAKPDPGAMTIRRLDFFGRDIVFVNAFAANDPVSTRQLWAYVLERHAEQRNTVAVFNCRSDRPDRSRQLGRELANWQPADRIVLMGTGTHIFAREATRSGVPASCLVFVEGMSVQQVFEKIVALAGSSALVMGMGNTAGGGLALAAYFNNRAAIEKERAA
jgi:gamma-polyglutamate synthase